MPGGNVHLSFLDPQGPIAALQRVHFYEVLGVLVVLVAIPIFVLTPWFAWRYRYGASGVRYTPHWDHFWLIEIATWAGPVAIVGALAFLLWRDSHRLDPYRPLASTQPALRIQVIGYDWKWLFIYPDQGIATVGTLAIPVGRPLALQLTSATVMQSLLIPALGSQIYAMGGMVTQLHLQATKPGRLLGENTMFNGRGFQQQRFTALALPAADFNRWVQNVKTHGIPFSERTLAAIAREGSRADLTSALSRSGAAGELELTDVPAGFFSTLVKATMNDAPVHLPSIAAGDRPGHPPSGSAVAALASAPRP
ncbi:MAG TPA: hypothetical protein VN660_13440 [Steroidobacteraceae bacterium]|nr:hypothetical protein [Steroidobacteraceae bacterium]